MSVRVYEHYIQKRKVERTNEKSRLAVSLSNRAQQVFHSYFFGYVFVRRESTKFVDVNISVFCGCFISISFSEKKSSERFPLF